MFVQLGGPSLYFFVVDAVPPFLSLNLVASFLFLTSKKKNTKPTGAYPEIRVAQFPLNMGKPGGGGGGGGKPSTNALAVATVAPTSAIAGTSANASTSSSSSRALVLGTTADGRPDYAAVVRQGHSAGVTVAADHSALVPKLDLIADPETHLARPAPEDEAATVAATRAALDAVVSGKIASVAPKNVARPPGAATYIKYTPKPGPLAAAVAGSSGSASQQPMTRIVKMQEMPVDPLEPPKFRHTKAPRGPGSPPVPVMHSPPRKVSAEEAANWKVPPCVSNWKNAKGYTIPLDKRLAADGRGLQETAINDGFAKFAEALYVAEHSAREAVELRAAVGRELASKEREAKERQLRELAAAARAERVGGGGGGGFGVGAGAGPSSSDRAPSIASVDLPPPPPRGGGGGGGGGGDDWSDLPPPPPRRTVDDRGGGGDEDDDQGGPRARGGDDDEDDETPAERAERRRRDEIRAERKRVREREARLEAAGGKRSRGARDADRDISEKVALGQAALGGGASGGARGVFSEAQYDQRLFNQDGGGLDAGLGAEDSYNLYDKPLFADRGKSIYRPRRGGGDEGGGEDEGGVGGRAFKPDVGFAGADGGGAAGGSSGPVRFEREQQQQVEQHEGGPSSAAAAVAPADDPFGIDAFVSSVSSKRAAAAAKNKGGSGSMRAAGGGGSAEDYLEGGGGSSRSKVAFERGKGT